MIIKIANSVVERNKTISHVLPVEVPPAPIALPATDITLFSFFSNWYSTVPVAGFYLDVANDSGFTSFVPGFNNLNVSFDVSTYFIPPILDCSESYYYRLRSYYVPMYTSPNSNVITAYTLSLNAPVIITATDVSYTSFTINWLPVINALEYHIDVDDDPDFSSPIYDDVNIGNIFSYNVVDVSSSTTYYYRVNAHNGDCMSNDSSVITTTTISYILPPPIATPATDVSYNSFYSNWLTVAAATGYRLYVSLDSSFSTHLPGYDSLDVGNVSTYIVEGLEQDTTYYYRLDAYNNYTTSVYSNIIEVTTPLQIYTACSDFAPYYATTPPTTGFLEVDNILSATADISTYVIEWRLNSSSGETVFISVGRG